MPLSKYRQSGVPTRGLSSRRILKLCNLSWVEAESQNWKIKVELLDLESSIEANIELLAEFLSIKVEFLLKSGIKNLYKWVIVE